MLCTKEDPPLYNLKLSCPSFPLERDFSRTQYSFFTTATLRAGQPSLAMTELAKGGEEKRFWSRSSPFCTTGRVTLPGGTENSQCLHYTPFFWLVFRALPARNSSQWKRGALKHPVPFYLLKFLKSATVTQPHHLRISFSQTFLCTEQMGQEKQEPQLTASRLPSHQAGMPLEAAELPSSVCTSAAPTPLQFQDLRAPVTSVQPSSPVTAQYPTALSKEARKINSFSFLAQTACQHLSQSRTPPHQMPTARRTELS